MPKISTTPHFATADGRRESLFRPLLAGLIASLECLGAATAATSPAPADEGKQPPPAGPGVPANPAPAVGSLYIREYRVLGAHHLPPLAVEEAVYPFLGPGRSESDVQGACEALEKVYKDKGFQAVSVQIPPQPARGGVVYLQVLEGTVAKLRVHGAQYFLPSQIKAAAPSLAEGKVVNFNDVTRDIVALNQLPDRKITPVLSAGEEPGTVNIDLQVTDHPPLHGSVELDNRYSAGTSPLRLDVSASYNNLWQLGHSIGGSFQISPQDLGQVQVYSAYYIARFQSLPWLSTMVTGTKQDSNVSTLGDLAVAGRGDTLGLRAMVALPPAKDFFHSVSFGFDYKHYNQGLTVSGVRTNTPVSYYPLSANYSATWAPKGSVTELNAGLNFHLRGMGSGENEFEINRHGADGSYVYLRGDLSHTHELPEGFQLFGKVQGQIADQPLLNSEQFAGGGLGTVRGYLEAEELGDNAVGGTVEFRSPSLTGVFRDKTDEWRIYAFGDGAVLSIREPLPQQESRFALASFGVGTRMRFSDHFNGSLDAAVPLFSQTNTSAHSLALTFRVWADF